MIYTFTMYDLFTIWSLDYFLIDLCDCKGTTYFRHTQALWHFFLPFYQKICLRIQAECMEN